MWMLFENIEYILYNGYYISNVIFRSKHVLKHYEEKEIFKILRDLIDLIRIMQSNKKRVNFWNFFVCFVDN